VLEPATLDPAVFYLNWHKDSRSLPSMSICCGVCAPSSRITDVAHEALADALDVVRCSTAVHQFGVPGA
jgi:hypothetical protein